MATTLPLYHQIYTSTPKKRWITGIIVFSIFLLSFSSWSPNSQQRTTRARRRLYGYSNSRLQEFNITAGLLWDHPLLNQVDKPNCTMMEIQSNRFEVLKKSKTNYLIAINLSSSSNILRSLLTAIYELLEFLDSSKTHFHISIYENGSLDSTPEQLYLFAKLLDSLGGIGYTIVSDPRPSGFIQGQRISGLAELRNLALRPLLEAPHGTFDQVIFLNDVVLCASDLMEIILQHQQQNSQMSCGMDYKYLMIPEFEPNYPLLFYDVWIARTIEGLPFYDIKIPSGEWKLPSRPLANSISRQRYDSLLPFQVYSCFNGVTVIEAEIFTTKKVQFRNEGGSDIQSECFLLCRDIWKVFSPYFWSEEDGKLKKGKGKGAKIMVAPRVAIGYSLEEYEGARQDRNMTSFENEWELDQTKIELIDWKLYPPKLVASYPYGRWNEVKWISAF